MGIFDRKPTATEPESFTEMDAVAFVALTGVASRGQVSDQGLANMHASLLPLTLFGRDPKNIENALQRAIKLSQRFSDNTLNKASEAIPLARRPAAFMLGAEIIVLGGALGEPQKDVLQALQVCLEVDEAVARKILEVVQLKYAR